MQGTYTAIIKQSGPWWIGWIEEVPGVNCQEPTRDELIDTLKVTLREALDLNRQDALAEAGTDYQELQLAV
jgi:predicted RNase H-like HicB family nuclease